MANYTHRIVTTRRHEWVLPNAEHGGWGVAIAEVHKAICAAEAAYREIHGKASTYDDWLRVWARDDEIVLAFGEEVRSDGE